MGFPIAVQWLITMLNICYSSYCLIKMLLLQGADVPYGKHDADSSLFKTYVETEVKGNTVVWEKGMKLEVLDPLDTWKELRVGTVLEIMDDGYLKVVIFT